MNRRNLWLVCLLGGHLLASVAFSVLNPLGEAPDEADHWAYVVHLARERSLPVGPRVTQSKHPPLYHGVAALVANIGTATNDFLRANPDVQIVRSDPWSPNFFIHTALEDFPWQSGVLSMHLARLWSAVLSTLTVAATYALGRTLFPRAMAVAWAGAALSAFLPEFAFIGGSVNNDNGVAFFGTLSLLAGARLLNAQDSLRRLWWAPLVVGCGLLVKTSAIGLWPAISLSITWHFVGNELSGGRLTLRCMVCGMRNHWRRWLLIHLYIFGGALLLASPWLLRNLRLYGDPLGIALAVQTIDLRTSAWSWADTQWLLRGWFLSFVGRFGGAGHIPMPAWIYFGYGLIGGMGLLGVLSSLGIYVVNMFDISPRDHWRKQQRRRQSTPLPTSPSLGEEPISTPGRSRVPQAGARRTSFSLPLAGKESAPSESYGAADRGMLPLIFLLFAVTGVAAGIWRYSLLALGTDQGRLLYPAVAAIMLCVALGLDTLVPDRFAKRMVWGLAGWGILSVATAMLLVLVPTFAPLAPADAAHVQAARLENPIVFDELMLIGWSAEADPTLFWQLSEENRPRSACGLARCRRGWDIGLGETAVAWAGAAQHRSLAHGSCCTRPL